LIQGVTSKPLQQQGILVGLGSLGAVVAAVIAAAVPSGYSGVRYGVLVVFLVAFAAFAEDAVAAVAVGVVGFLVFGGFLVNQLGELSWHGAADFDRLLAVTAAISVGRLAGDVYRWRRRSARPTKGSPRSPLSEVVMTSSKEMRDA